MRLRTVVNLPGFCPAVYPGIRAAALGPDFNAEA